MTGSHGLPAVRHAMEAVDLGLGSVREEQTAWVATLTLSSATQINALVSKDFYLPCRI